MRSGGLLVGSCCSSIHSQMARKAPFLWLRQLPSNSTRCIPTPQGNLILCYQLILSLYREHRRIQSDFNVPKAPLKDKMKDSFFLRHNNFHQNLSDILCPLFSFSPFEQQGRNLGPLLKFRCIFFQFPVICFSQHKQGPEFSRGNVCGIQKEEG